MVQSDVVRGREKEGANQRHRRCRPRPSPRGTESRLSFLLCVPFLDLSSCSGGDESIVVVVSWSSSLLLQVLLVEEEGEEMVVEDESCCCVLYSMEHSMNHLTK